MMKISQMKALGLLAAVALLAACQPGQDERSPGELAEARWQHMIEREFDQAWDYYSPGFREQMSREAFAAEMSRRNLRWLGAELRREDCEQDRCTVTMKVDYRADGAPMGQGRVTMSRSLEETWIRLDGRWWYAAD